MSYLEALGSSLSVKWATGMPYSSTSHLVRPSTASPSMTGSPRQ
ncbi:hypothetical protein PF003_g24900 [Phytophthora fragariae]|nr:hypothetical protein PF003_g24900 [Phytophthora fragariae]